MLEITVRSGACDRTASLVTTTIPAEASPALHAVIGAPTIAAAAPRLVWLRDVETASAVAAQVDPDGAALSFLLPGTLTAGGSRRFLLTTDQSGPPITGPAPAYPVQLVERLDRVVFQAGGEAWAVYNTQGGRRPYFWPLLGPAGASVVRGQGTAEHPHHTGMGLAYGGHSEGGSTNIWSDWDEPPYGPGGRMLHRGIRRLTSGPVYGELVQDLTYVDAVGEPIADEVRTIRCWFGSAEARYLDFRFDIRRCSDNGPRPFLFAIRLPGEFDVPATGRVTNAAGRAVPPRGRDGRAFRAAWVDGSGPTGGPPPLPPAAPPEVLVDLPGAPRQESGPGEGPWNGIALFDHPDNHGFPNVVGKYAVVQQISQVHYPPPEAPDGPFSFRQRVYVHAGDAETAAVAARAADYADPCAAEVRVTSDEPGQ